jgi:N-acetylmuramoyl-L-alanine amidase
VLPLVPGNAGEPVADLQGRLTALGIEPTGDVTGSYGEGTADSVRHFQRTRGLKAHGTCDQMTWAALVEAGYRLGDRMLYRRTPMQRGDDVAALQRQLSTFGFYSGLIDGIFGDMTAAAVATFQRNVGLPVDAVLGPRTLHELERVRSPSGADDLVSPVRERLVHTASRALSGARIAIGEEGGFAAGVAALSRALSAAGALPISLHHPDGSHIAAEANAVDALVYVGLQLDPSSSSCRTSFYRGFRYESDVSRRLAELIQSVLPKQLGLTDDGALGMALPILRETKMPAVLIEVGDPAVVVQHTGLLAAVIVNSLTSWMSMTWE